MSNTLLSRVFLTLLLTATIISVSSADPNRDIEIELRISPNTIVIGSPGDWVTAHTDIAFSSVNTATVSLNGVPAAWTLADNKGNLVAKFVRDDVENIISPPDALLSLTGMTIEGENFSGSDVVRVIERECR
jgi:hypothetical protein